MKINTEKIEVTSYFSKDSLHRFGIRRIYSSLERKKVCFIMINPSYADERFLDKTNMIATNIGIRKKYGEIVILNMYSMITNSLQDFNHNDKVANREENNDFIINECSTADKIILVWGINEKYNDRKKEVLNLIKEKKLCSKLYAIKYIDSEGKVYCPAHLSRYISDNKQNFSLVKISCTYL